MPLQRGTKLGPYQIESPLGDGGMGEVYKATDTRLERTIAIKVLPAHVASDPERKQRFERDAKTVAALSHPHICPVFDVGFEVPSPLRGEGQGERDAIDFLVMEYLEGETLAERLQKGALPLDQALRHAIEIADALDKAHRQGVTHRDLKPANIMLTKAGAKLLDFGLAKLKPTGPQSDASTKLADSLTQQGTILGTFQYMAPEQLEGKDADGRTDIWVHAPGGPAGGAGNMGDTMGKCENSIIIDQPVTKVWKAIRDFHNMSWAKGVIETCDKVGDTPGNEVGAQRLLNGAFHETLLSVDGGGEDLHLSDHRRPRPHRQRRGEELRRQGRPAPGRRGDLRRVDLDL